MQLQPKERDKIALWFNQGKSLREIGRRLSRDVSVISRELKRNRCAVGYVAISAQAKTKQRRHQARYQHYQPLKDRVTFAYVLNRLGRGWSPEEISGRLRRKHHQQIIHHETIYQFIYDPHNRSKKLWEYLPRKQTGRSVSRCRIPDRVSIHLRPEPVNQRREFGHHEGDTIEGRRATLASLHTEVERVSRFLLAGKIASITSRETIKAQHRIFSCLPPVARKSTTLDNGKENHLHHRLKALGMSTYFADPYASWQRGSNEYHNGLLRRYFPKGTDFTTVSQREINDVVWEINHRPRKVLNYATPQEIFDRLLINPDVAILDRM